MYNLIANFLECRTQMIRILNVQQVLLGTALVRVFRRLGDDDYVDSVIDWNGTKRMRNGFLFATVLSNVLQCWSKNMDNGKNISPEQDKLRQLAVTPQNLAHKFEG